MKLNGWHHSLVRINVSEEELKCGRGKSWIWLILDYLGKIFGQMITVKQREVNSHTEGEGNISYPDTAQE